MTNTPFAVTEKELNELASVSELRELWGAENEAEMGEILRDVYTAKFEFMNESPGYVGDLFMIQAGCLAAETPVVRVIRERGGKLSILD